MASVAGELVSFEDFLPRLASEAIGGLWVAGGYVRPDWIDAEQAAVLSQIELTIVHDLFESPLWAQATYQLPGVAFAERAGSYVNFNDRLQSFDWAIRPPAGVMSDGQLLWRLTKRSGLYQPRKILADVAREISFFAAAAGPMPAEGVDLRIHQLAEA